jgi:tRNA-splicing ligase RtcB (3'-phosphate/5'-hydroxy nucleic acid ligase)
LPIYVWAEPEHLEGFDSAIEQAKNLANHPLARQHIALMPDFHVGYGMPIGGVLATQGGVLPNAVGVDIGCGMIAVRTEVEADSLDRETLPRVRQAIHRNVPVGFAKHEKAQKLWEGGEPDPVRLPVIAEQVDGARMQIGTLGGGNHFVEVQRDQDGYVWLMVHSGSRNIGKRICDHYDKVARGYMTRMAVLVPSADLSYLPEDAPEHDEYLESMEWCLRFAEESRERMLSCALEAVESVTGRTFAYGTPVQTHHNYASREDHGRETVLVHRKGAVRARGLVTIPGSMGTASYIARGKDNPASFGTCSHGAGRVLGRKEANRRITREAAEAAMAHVVFGIRDGDYDEMPQAYKDIDMVMANQSDLVEPEVRLTPMAVVKG